MNKHRRRVRHQSLAMTAALVACGRKIDNDGDPKVIQTLGCNLQAAGALADQLQATLGLPGLDIIAPLQTLLRNAVELLENISGPRLRLSNADDVLSAAGHPRQHNRQSSQPRVMAPPEEEPGNMCQPISAITD